MATSPITAWQIEGEKVETVIDFLFSGFKITVDGDCSHEFRRQLLLGRKAMTNRDSVLKSRDITLPTKVFSQGSGLPSGYVQLWELDCKKSRMPKNWCLQTSIVVLKKTPESPLDSQSEGRLTLNTHWKYWCWSWSWSSSILVISCKQKTHLKSLCCWERLRAEGEEGVRGWDGWVASPMQWTWTWANLGRWWGTGRPGVLRSMGLQSQTRLGGWTTRLQRLC